MLLAGGYLILDRPHSGLVLALDARFYSSVESCVLSTEGWGADVSTDGMDDNILIEVHSPQFRDVRRYAYRPRGENPLVLLVPSGAQPPHSLG